MPWLFSDIYGYISHTSQIQIFKILSYHPVKMTTNPLQLEQCIFLFLKQPVDYCGVLWSGSQSERLRCQFVADDYQQALVSGSGVRWSVLTLHAELFLMGCCQASLDWAKSPH